MIDIPTEFLPVLGLTAWGVACGYGSFVTLEFGEPELSIRGPLLMSNFLEGAPSRSERRLAFVHGQWHLWIYCCEWSISLNGVQIAHSESEEVRVNRALGILNGQILTKFSVTGVAHTQFEFDLGCVLTTWPSSPDSYDGEAVEQWYLHEPDNQVLTLRSDGYVSLGHGRDVDE